MTDLIDLNLKPIKDTLKILLQDKTTKKNIIWATDSYKDFGSEYRDKQQVTVGSLTGLHSLILQPRISKSLEQQQDRTRQKAEVFTPSWICNKMNNYCDEQYFDEKDVFNIEKDNSWETNENKIIFKNDDEWQDYVNLRKLEITCGESPFIASRYDASTGVLIVPPSNRIGFLDRKIRVVNENTTNEKEWFDWIVKAYQSTYGYEFQGDSLLIGRINLLMTFVDNIEYKWNRQPTVKETETIANIISRNLFQMDGLTDTVPLGLPQPKVEEMTIFDFLDEKEENENEIAPDCKIYDWKKKVSITFKKIKERKSSMKFDCVIGNPPYQDTTDSDSTRMPPVYNYFMDESYKIADIVELITPARFLFDAGYTPREWNRKMLNDEHLKICMYEADCTKVFANTDIKGGVAISYRDCRRKFGSIGIFTKYQELNDILKKVKSIANNFLDEIISSPLSFRVSDLMVKENPSLVGRLRSSAFTALSDIFFESKPSDNKDYIRMIGLSSNKRVVRYVRRDYIVDAGGTLDKYSLLVSKANGSGNFGETLSTLIISDPGLGYLQTFIGIGQFDNLYEAENVCKYIKCKFTRAMLGVLKVTQDCPGPKWKYVPLQNFTSNSDIDWSMSVHEIDLQLYKKYGLSDEEIEFIETHVKEME